MKFLKIILAAGILLVLPLKLSAQAPFTTLVKHPVAIKKQGNQYVVHDLEAHRQEAQNTFDTRPDKDDGQTFSYNWRNVVQADDDSNETKSSVGFFKNSSLALNVLEGAENRASINSQVLFYKINIFTPVDDKPKNYKYNIPAMVISKLSTTYDSISGASAIDVLDYEAAPVTFRIMPSWKISKNDNYKEKLLFGFYADARGINVQNTEANDYDVEVVGSAGLGFTLTGEGEAGFYNEDGEYQQGNWLVSAMIQGAIGDEDVIQRLFNTENDYVTSFQSYFMFKISDDSKFNLKIGYQHFFQETVGGTKNNFSIALGI